MPRVSRLRLRARLDGHWPKRNRKRYGYLSVERKRCPLSSSASPEGTAPEPEAETVAAVAALLVEPRGTAAAELRAVLGHLAACGDPGVTAAALAEGCDALRALCEDVVLRGQRRRELRGDVSPRVAARVLLASAAAVIGAPRSGPAPQAAVSELLTLSLRGMIEPKPRLKWSPGRSGGGGA